MKSAQISSEISDENCQRQSSRNWKIRELPKQVNLFWRIYKLIRQRYSHPRVGANAGARMVTHDHTRHSDEPYVSLDIFNEIVTRADHLSHIKLKIGFATIDNIPCLLEIDRIKFNTITGRMRVEAG